jgi:hypothetical protein
MLRPDAQGIERVYLHRAAVDMRRQIDGLSLLAREERHRFHWPRHAGQDVITLSLNNSTGCSMATRCGA